MLTLIFLACARIRTSAIILSAHHIDIHPDPDVMNTIRHEIAHALTPGHGHDDVWAAKAKEIGCDNTLPCRICHSVPRLSMLSGRARQSKLHSTSKSYARRNTTSHASG